MMISSSNQRPSKSGLRGVERRAMDLHCLPFQQNPICTGTRLLRLGGQRFDFVSALDSSARPTGLRAAASRLFFSASMMSTTGATRTSCDSPDTIPAQTARVQRLKLSLVRSRVLLLSPERLGGGG